MRPGPRNPGESAADYNARVKAMEAKWKAGMGRPKGGGTKSTTPVRVPKDPGTGAPKPRGGVGGGVGGGVKGGTQGASKPGLAKPSGLSPIPPKPSTPKKPVVTTPRPIRSGINDGLGNGVRGSVKGGAGTGGGRGTAPRPGYGGGKPKMR